MPPCAFFELALPATVSLGVGVPTGSFAAHTPGGSSSRVATSAGAGKELILGLVPLVDRQMIMTYGYRNSSSTTAGAVAPLDNTTRTVKAHITRILQWAPANTVLLGVPYYGYDWPVTKLAKNAPARMSRWSVFPSDAPKQPHRRRSTPRRRA